MGQNIHLHLSESPCYLLLLFFCRESAGQYVFISLIFLASFDLNKVFFHHHKCALRKGFQPDRWIPWTEDRAIIPLIFWERV